MQRVRAILTFGLFVGLLPACGSGPPAAEVQRSINARVQSMNSNREVIRGERLLEPAAIARFYKARDAKPAWEHGEAEQIVNEIRGLERDGLTPSHYHLGAIQKLIEQRDGKEDAAHAADLDILLSDAVAAAVDDVRFGRVRPIALDRRWNVNPRENAPPLEERVALVAGAVSPAEGFQKARHNHFIYAGLVGALERLRKLDAEGGWPAVPKGKDIKPGGRDPRMATIRMRLAASGELDAARRGEASTQYDPELEEAVKLFQARHRIDPSGVIDKETIDAMNVGTRSRIDQVRVNLERARWVLGGLGDEFLLVNLPAYKAYLIRGGKNVWETRTQIGDEARETPSFRAVLNAIEFNPDWTVPPTILAEDVLEGMRRGENVIAKKRLNIIDRKGNRVDPGSIDWGSASADNFQYTLHQPPGPGSALGQVKFLFPNRFTIYLHDTPHKELFEADRRTFSSGCIRVENALEFADVLLRGQDGWNRSRIERVVATDNTQTVKLAHPVPILIVYWTVSVGASGEIRYMRDIYDRDRPVLAALNASRPA